MQLSLSCLPVKVRCCCSGGILHTIPVSTQARVLPTRMHEGFYSPLLVLDLGFHVVGGIRGLHLKGQSLLKCVRTKNDQVSQAQAMLACTCGFHLDHHVVYILDFAKDNLRHINLMCKLIFTTNFYWKLFCANLRIRWSCCECQLAITLNAEGCSKFSIFSPTQH